MKITVFSTCGNLNKPEDMVPLKKTTDMLFSRTTLTSLLKITDSMTKVLAQSDLVLTNSLILPMKK